MLERQTVTNCVSMKRQDVGSNANELQKLLKVTSVEQELSVGIVYKNKSPELSEKEQVT